MKKNITLERWLRLAGLLKEEVYENEETEKDLDEDSTMGFQGALDNLINTGNEEADDEEK